MSTSPRRAALASRAALALLIVAAFAPVRAQAQSSWLQSLPPEQVLRLRPETADSVLHAQLRVQAQSAASAQPISREGASLATAGAGAWELQDMPRRKEHAVVFDSRRECYLIVGGWNDHDPALAIWRYDPAAQAWSVLAPWVDPDNSTLRTFQAAVYDSLRDRLLVLTCNSALQLDALALSGTPAWSHLWSGPAADGAGFGAGLALDTRRDQLDLIGVWDAAAATQRILRVPMSDPASWTSELTAGDQPAPTSSCVAVYDARRDSFIVLFRGPPDSEAHFGSLNAQGTPTWGTIDLGYISPCDGSLCGLALDVARDRLLMVDDRQVAYAMSLTDHSLERLDGGPCGGNRPGSAMAFDPRTRRMVYSVAFSWDLEYWEPSQTFFSLGVDSGVVADPNQVRRAGAAAWLPEGPSGFGSHEGHASFMDAPTRQLVVFGGWGTPAAYTATNGMVLARPLNGPGGWEILGASSVSAPAPRFLPSVCDDPMHGALLLYGGQLADGSGAMPGDLWSLSLAPNGVWTKLTPSGSGPPPLRGSAFFYDAAHRRFVLMGGDDLTNTVAQAWELKLDPTPAWRPLAVSGDTGLPYLAVYADDVRGDAWSTYYLGLSHLTLGLDEVHGDALGLTGAPSPAWTTLGFDPIQRRLLASARRPQGLATFDLASLWTVALGDSARFSPIGTAGQAPRSRYEFSSVYDPEAGRLLLTGGYDDGPGRFDDLWTLQFPPDAATPVLASLVSALVDARGAHLRWNFPQHDGLALTVDRSADGTAWASAGVATDLGADVIAFDDATPAAGGRMAYRLLATAAGATRVIGDVVWVTFPGGAVALSLSPLANPTRGPLTVRLSLAPGASARVRLLDVSGRLVSEATVPAGATVWTFVAPHRAGLYFAQVEQAGQRRSARIVSAP